MNKAKITFKGQVTIPREVRNALGIEEGDSVLFMVEKDRAILKPVKKKSLRDLYGILPATRPYPGMESVRKEVHQKLSKRLHTKETK